MRISTQEKKVEEETMPLKSMAFVPGCHITFLRENHLEPAELEGVLEIIYLNPVIIQWGKLRAQR